MKQLQYFSPTSFSAYCKDLENFYLIYLSDNRPPRFPQTTPMSVGAAFDAYVKSYITKALFGEKDDKAFDFTTIFEQQVEEQNRAYALEAGRHCFDIYKKSGALASLMLELERGSGHRFEFKIENRISHTTESQGVPLLGKPDVYFISKTGQRIIYDWKVNGYCGNSRLSPKPGYICVRDEKGLCAAAHKNCQVMKIGDFDINVASYFETIDESWAQQLTIYGWVLGEPIGSDFLIGIEQLVCSRDSIGTQSIRVATHRSRVSLHYQKQLFKNILNAWEILNSGWIFRNMTEDESKARCAALDTYNDGLQVEGFDWLLEKDRQHSNW